MFFVGALRGWERGKGQIEGQIAGWLEQEPNRNRKPEPPEPFFQEPKEEPEPPEPFFGNRNRNRRSLLNSTETQEKDLRRGTARTENRKRSNRSNPKP